MVMNFWQAQREAKTKTALYIGIFIVLTMIAAALAEAAMRIFARDSYGYLPFLCRIRLPRGYFPCRRIQLHELFAVRRKLCGRIARR